MGPIAGVKQVKTGGRRPVAMQSTEVPKEGIPLVDYHVVERSELGGARAHPPFFRRKITVGMAR